MIEVSSRASCFHKILCLLLMIGFVPDGRAEKVDPSVEQVRRDLGYYRQGDQETGATAAELKTLREEFRQTLERQDARLQRIEETLKIIKERRETVTRMPMLPASPAAAATNHSPAVAAKVSSNLSVCGQGCDFQDLQKAVDAAPSGGTVSVSAEINGSCAVINKPIRLLGLRGEDGRRAHLRGGVCLGKAPLVTMAENIVIEGFEISGIGVESGNGACVRMDAGTRNLEIRNLYCHDSQMALLGSVEGRLLIEDSLFERTISSPGLSHGLYLASGDEAVIRRCKILSISNAGHSLKSGFKKLTVEDSVIAALSARNSRAIDAFRGGDIVLRRNIIQQGPESDNNDVIGLALEPSRVLASHHSVLLEDNWIIFDNPNRDSKILFRGQALGPILVRNNVFLGMTGLGIAAAKEEGNQWFDTREQAGLAKFDGSLGSLPSPGKLPATSGDSIKQGASWRLF